jgi:uncharacterized protein YdeI (YjbR/CyaY-like superfamily)
MKPAATKKLPHGMPEDLRSALAASAAAGAAWRDVTPIARNEFFCWVTSAAKAETRARRIAVAVDKLVKGERRPCCWAGCPHR